MSDGANNPQSVHVVPEPDDERTTTPSIPNIPAPTKPRSAWPFRVKLMVSLLFPVFLETLDYTVVATAQPHIASTFNRLDLQSYIGTVYVLTSTVFLPIFASFSDIFGRHWAMQLSLILFAIGSALSTGAQNMPMMLAGRGIAGVGAAGLLTVVRIILADSSSLDANNFQGSIIVLLYAVGFSVGPYIGGALTGINFRWVFAINLPCCALSMLLCFVFLRGIAKPPQPRRSRSGARTQIPDSPHHETTLEKILRIDTPGALLFVFGGILVLLGLNWGSTLTWGEAKVVACFVVGGLLFVGFVLWEWFAERGVEDDVSHQEVSEKQAVGRRSSWTRPETMIPLAIFTNYDVCATQLAAFSSGMVMLVAFYFLAIFFTIVLDKSPSSAGLQLIYFAPGMGVGTILSIQAIKRLRQPKIPIVVGTTLVPIALGFLSLAMKVNNEGMADGFLVMCGVGIGLTFGPLAIHARFSQPDDRVAIVMALNLFFRTFGGTVGLAQCGAVLNAKVRSYITNLFTSGVLTPEEASQLASLGNIDSIQAISELSPELAQHVRDAFRLGVRWAFISLIPWTGLAVIGVLFLSNIRDTDRERREAGNTTVAASANATETPEQDASPPPKEKPRIYGPVSLIIYLVKKRLAKRREAAARKAEVPGGGA